MRNLSRKQARVARPLWVRVPPLPPRRGSPTPRDASTTLAMRVRVPPATRETDRQPTNTKEGVTMPTNINNKLISWASEIDDQTIRQAEKTARLPIVEGHVALMPDAHVGIGATVGSVIPTKNAVIPSAVGVDIGCGMIAAELDVTEEDRKSTRLNSSHVSISYAVFCLKKK